jgi:uncharacterized protein YndB with AHSA1/START domain
MVEPKGVGDTITMGAEPADRVLVLTREFDAPRARVFAAWTEPERLQRWYAPRGFVLTRCEGDLRPGGGWRSCMRAPDGAEYCVAGVYREIVPDERIAFTHAWEGDHGRRGYETLVTVTLVEREGRTEMRFRQRVFRSAESRDSHRGGWSECFDRLDAYLGESR